MINSIRSGYEIQQEIDNLELLKVKLSKLDLWENYNLLVTEITSIVTVLNWVGQKEGFPTPSKHIKEFIYKKTQIIL